MHLGRLSRNPTRAAPGASSWHRPSPGLRKSARSTFTSSSFILKAHPAEQPQSVQQQAQQQLLVQQQEPGRVLEECLRHIKGRNLEQLWEYVPDDAIDAVVDWRNRTGKSDGYSFADVLKVEGLADTYLDTYATRTLVHSAPCHIRALSAIRAGPDKFLQRCAVVAPSGEECTLTFQLVLQETLQSQYRGPPLVQRRWMLGCITGEAGCEDLPAHPSPSFPPESVVEAQLQALRDGNVAALFAFVSPEFKAKSGPVQAFVELMRSRPLDQLMGHARAEVVRRAQPTEDTFVQIVRITPKDEGSALCDFAWIVRRQGASNNFHNCWMTDSVDLVPLSASLKWVGPM